MDSEVSEGFRAALLSENSLEKSASLQKSYWANLLILIENNVFFTSFSVFQ